MFSFIEELFPLCRSITGEGIRETFRRIGQKVPLETHEVDSGTPVLDWTVPPEWNIKDAYIKDMHGKRVVDFRAHNLHVVGYSTPVTARMSLAELKPHIFSLPEHPDVIPYRTSYYAESWGFCMEHRRLMDMPEGEYDVCIDSSLKPGTLTYAECLLAGEMDDEVLISCHCCHPSIANDNLSGIAVATGLAERLARVPRRLSYRFLFIPGTIGSITWLARNESSLGRIQHGLVVTCVGDKGSATYKKSRRGNAVIDRAATHILRHSGRDYEVVDFSPYGYDERQYCSPGFDLPVGSLMRTPNGMYPEYHTSADNLELVSPVHLADSLLNYLRIIDVLENDRAYRNLNPKGEPQLGMRGLYPSVGAQGAADSLMARLWVLNLSDGEHTLLDIAERAQMPFREINDAAEALCRGGILEAIGLPSRR